LRLKPNKKTQLLINLILKNKIIYPHVKANYMFICIIHIKIVKREKKNRETHVFYSNSANFIFNYTITERGGIQSSNPMIPLTRLLKSPWDDGVLPLSKSPVIDVETASQSLLPSFMTFYIYIYIYIYNSFVEYLALMRQSNYPLQLWCDFSHSNSCLFFFFYLQLNKWKDKT